MSHLEDVFREEGNKKKERFLVVMRKNEKKEKKKKGEKISLSAADLISSPREIRGGERERTSPAPILLVREKGNLKEKKPFSLEVGR